MLADLIPDPATTLNPWPTRPLHFHHDPSRFECLLTLAQVDELIDSGCVPARNVELAGGDGTLIQRYTYTDGDMPQPGYIRRHLRQGGTVSLRRMHTVRPPIAALREAIAIDTGADVHVNAYLTPGRRQGFRYHYDSYVTLIVQLHGEKTWPVHPPFVENPVPARAEYEPRGFTREEVEYLATTPPAQEYTLRPGDVFWLPRGWIHAPHAVSDEPSLHLTVAVQERTLAHLVKDMAAQLTALAFADPALRAQVPLREAASTPTQSVAYLRTYLHGALELLDAGTFGRRLPLTP
ncbi:cupin domain-containing protein [Streptomyces castrisilvae]|uniref:Ribosomal oxygenase 2 n=1 Tax=Streptomyces castrisilvae TaxID=3033811 RepID=A0ABY9HJC0_9ACTN|nr:cupin domain-containing protein [Streptomyces sp. Mut1]WLQ34229.1 cupin domain-containing protein [Streptomyces sp. Mut1]